VVDYKQNRKLGTFLGSSVRSVKVPNVTTELLAVYDIKHVRNLIP